jgi:anti-sigma-K factor RskA
VSNDDKNSAGSGSYVLNAMNDNERKEFEARMNESQELRNEVTELTDTAVLLGLAVEPVTPPSALKQNIMARLSQTPQLSRDEAEGEFAPVRTLRAVPPLASEEPRQDGRPAANTPAETKAATRWYARPAVIVAGAAAAVALIFGGVVTTNSVLQGASTSQQADALAAISSASDAQRAEASVSTGGTATLVWSNKLGRSAIIGKNLAALPSDKTYELWYIDGAGKATGAGLFESKGKSTLQVLTGKMAKGDTIGVTVEPAGGSKSPTTKPIVAITSA